MQYREVIKEVFKKDDRLWNKEKTEFNTRLLFYFIDKMDETVIGLLLNEEKTKEKFFIKQNDVYVFKDKDFKFFVEENKIFNSYTSYENRLGLSNGTEFIVDNNDVVINFPFKDCVLEGGQTTEEGNETYFEYDEKVTKTEENKGWEAENYNEKQGKRNEIFYNEILAKDEIDRLLDKKALVNWKRYTKDGVEKVDKIKRDKNGLIKENLIIKGNNLLTLHSLESQFSQQVKLIYIDIPYNTGNDSFAYNDKFNHSSWLTFMKNRLEISKNMLRPDGVIFVHCDDNEQAYLKVLLDEIYGRNNFVNSISVLSSTPSGLKTAHREKTIIKIKDHILVYKKENIKIKPQYTQADEWDTHFNYYFDKANNEVISLKDVVVQNKIYPEDVPHKDYSIKDKEFLEFVLNNSENIFQTGKSMPEDIRKISLKPENKDVPVKYNTGGKDQYAYNGRRMSFLSNSVKEIIIGSKKQKMISKLVCDFWDDIDFNNSQNEGGVSFPAGKKPEKLLHRIIDMITEKGDIVLDFFVGSGTTAAVAHKMGRQYIGIEQLDYINDITIKRLTNVINGESSGISNAVNWENGGSFIYFELAKWNEEAKNEIINCSSLEELKNLFSNLCDKYYLDYNLNINKFKNIVMEEEEFKKISLEEQKRMFVTMLDLNQLYVQESEMEDKRFGINKDDQRLTKEFYKGD
ncbi:MAG: site-specific DNA-methyltransferase [Tissierellia bacterium]|nr:site-specific DNA-methyltransferase [Tissierellia bacterium]